MSASNSIGQNRAIKLPNMPDDFPLCVHLASGQWRKTLRRRDYYFGKLPDWNFGKYLVGRDGAVLGFYPPKTPPDDPELRRAIEAALG
jgi:glutathione peroxidase-family protein